MKTKLKIASGSYNRNMSRNHYTTLGFGQLSPVYCEQVLPNDNVTIKPELFGRSQQSILPTLTRLSVTQRCFYVPYSSVWKHWDNFINGLPLKFSNGNQSGFVSVYCKEVPYITPIQLTNLFINNADPEGGLVSIVSLSDIQSVTDSDYYDFYVNNENPSSPELSNIYYKFTSKGKNLLKILHSLGYNINFSKINSYGGATKLNFLDLACYFKVIFDRYFPSQLRVNSVYDTFFTSLNDLRPSSTGFINVPDWLLQTICLFPNLYYDNNYFTSQWLKPNEPVPNYISPYFALSENVIHQEDEHTTSIIATDTQVEQRRTSDVPNPSTSATKNIMMSSLRKFVMRMGLTGCRAIDRYFTQFGVHVPELELSMCKYIGSIDAPIQMMDVTSTGETDSLGEMAGKSWVAQSDGTFKVDCDQHGVVLVLASIDVPSQFVSGTRRRVMHLRPFDFYTPDFDDTTLQATAGNELFGQFLDCNSSISIILNNLSLNSTKVFGFSARYDEYRKPIDDITGDFVIPSLNLPIDGYVNPRRLFDLQQYYSDNRADVVNPDVGFPLHPDLKQYGYSDDIRSGLAVTPVNILAQNDTEQFNRIYKDLEGRADPLRCHYHFNVWINGCVKPSDIAQFVDGNGSTIEIEKNGNKFD